jgi:lipopolysaccharide/colanic/teichoic acid biosynthesis glycosyltransferase
MKLYPKLKRIADVVLAMVALLVLSVILLPIMIWLRFSAEGKVFYRQRRVGYRNRDFYIWKFATMLQASPQMGTGSLTLRNDPRVTPPGRFLRKTKINELPQLLNVLTGDMSFVGPRPQMQEDFEVYPLHVKAKIYDVKPGITGIGSIIFRDEERMISQPGRDPKAFYAENIAPYKGAVELWYQENCTFMTDIKIILLTIGVLFFPNSTTWQKASPSIPKPPEMLFLPEHFPK